MLRGSTGKLGVEFSSNLWHYRHFYGSSCLLSLRLEFSHAVQIEVSLWWLRRWLLWDHGHKTLNVAIKHVLLCWRLVKHGEAWINLPILRLHLVSLELVRILEVIIVPLTVELSRIHSLRDKCLLLRIEIRLLSRESILNRLIISVCCSYICASTSISTIPLVLRPELLNIF